MKQLPTAEEFLYQKDILNPTRKITQVMIEFAKLHVQAALKEALESIPCLGSSTDIPTYGEVENAVLNAYPLDNVR